MGKALNIITEAIIAGDDGIEQLIKDNWVCLDQDDKRLVRVLRRGSGGSGELTYVSVPVDSDAAGSAGQVAQDDDYFYYYASGAGKWRRTPGNIF